MKNPFADENVTSENLWILLTIPVALVLGAVGAGVVVVKKLRAKIDRRREAVLTVLDLADREIGKTERQKRTKKESL